MNPIRQPLQCILPPHMLNNMYANGSALEKRAALDSMLASAQLRSRRQVLAEASIRLAPAAVMGKQRRVFTAAFKMEAVRRMEEQRALKIPVSEIARDLDVRPDMLRTWARRWRARAGQAPTDVFPGEGKLPSAEEELRQLRRELDVARQEAAFLKKAAAYFARESR